MYAYKNDSLLLIDPCLNLLNSPHPIPYIIDDYSLAMHLGVRCKTLWWLIFTRVKQYNSFTIPKANNKMRLLYAPHKELKFVQRRINQVILQKLPVLDCVSAYVTGKTCAHAAQVHTNKSVRIAIDLKDFFPSHTGKIVTAYFKSLGYPEQVADLLSQLCTYPKPYTDYKNNAQKSIKNIVPQGSPASPTLCNLIAQEKLDKVILAHLTPLGWDYTRYSDDLSFSFQEKVTKQEVQNIITLIKNLIKQETPYKINYEKIKVQYNNRRQHMLGIVVNEKVNIANDVYIHYRSLLHNCYTEGLEVNRIRYLHDKRTNANVDLDTNADFIRHIQGKVSYFKSINPAKQQRLKTLLDKVIEKEKNHDRNINHPTDKPICDGM